MPQPAIPSRRVMIGSLTAGLGSLAAASAAAQGGGGLPATPTGRPDPQLERPPQQAEDRRLGWAVAGLGHFAQAYALPALGRALMSRPAGLISGSPDKLRAVGARYGIGEAHRYGYDMARLRDDDSVQVVYVITPNSTHAELTVRALEAGKHVMCEKPMATSAADCQRMIDAAKAAGRRLMIAYRAHFEPYNMEARRMAEAGELGRIWFAASDHHRPLDPSKPRDEWRMRKDIAGGGSLVDIGIYSLNGLIWLLGEEPVAVTATIHSPPGDKRFAEIENVMTAQLEFASGARVNISSGYTADKKRIDLWGDKAVAVLDPATAYKDNRLTLSNAREQRQVISEAASAEQFTGVIDHLSNAILNNGAVATPGEMGLRDMRIIEALYRSAATQQRVALNPDMTMKG
ncbi:Gfo/Idh/MocA family protein [Teichococcus oryzae]|uniref:Gfo/Idh/MocA family oxidoreductase n=1 Tax=Teichococcus oryzae TaxID=1608942 RepID=A0A5B2TJM8_9PROT|nr:Gfo/Idh/MocA family oxidoreductase [Pseudoroseomonas oryzae]KAA2214303.1 Gfo/Idh/MocA family oxidoreductase [Pseudoroseomonas oryzae]